MARPARLTCCGPVAEASGGWRAVGCGAKDGACHARGWLTSAMSCSCTMPHDAGSDAASAGSEVVQCGSSSPVTSSSIMTAIAQPARRQCASARWIARTCESAQPTSEGLLRFMRCVHCCAWCT